MKITEAQYKYALSRAEELMDAEDNSKDEKDLDIFATIVEIYGAVFYKIGEYECGIVHVIPSSIDATVVCGHYNEHCTKCDGDGLVYPDPPGYCNCEIGGSCDKDKPELPGYTRENCRTCGKVRCPDCDGTGSKKGK